MNVLAQVFGQGFGWGPFVVFRFRDTGRLRVGLVIVAKHFILFDLKAKDSTIRTRSHREFHLGVPQGLLEWMKVFRKRQF